MKDAAPHSLSMEKVVRDNKENRGTIADDLDIPTENQQDFVCFSSLTKKTF